MSVRLACIVVLLAFLRPAIWAQGHEIIFLVDQSGSMSRPHGPNRTWAANDSMENRLAAISQGYGEVQKYLNDHRIANVTHRIDVVEFGGRAIARPDLTTIIRYDPSGLSSQSDQDRLKRLLVSRDLGDTDTRAGFEEVEKIVNGLAGVPPDRVHVVMVTDGKPYVDGVDTGLGSPYVRSLDTMIGRLRQRATLDVIGVGDSTGRDPYWPTWGPYWTRVSQNRAFGEPTGPQISTRMQWVIRDRLGIPQAAAAPNPYYCPPYLRSITFTVFKSQRGGHAQIKDANGRLLQAGQPDVTIINEVTYDRITVDNPPPGLWELDRQAAKVTVDLLYKQVARLEPKNSLNVQTPTSFRYQVLSDQNLPFQPLPQYPVAVSVEVTDSKGVKNTAPLGLEPAGTFRSTAPFQFTAPGVARLHMAGTTTLPDKSVATVFEADEPLTVTNKTLLILHASSSLPASVPLLAGRGTLSPRITAQTFPGGAPVPLASITARPDDLLEFRVVRPDGQPLADWRKMPAAASAAASAEAPVRVSLFSLPWLRRQSDVFAQVRVNESVLHPDYAVRELRRNDADPGEFDKSAALPALLNDPLATPVVLSEWLPSFLALFGMVGLALMILTYVGYRYLRKFCYWIGDSFLFHQRVTLVFKPPFATEDEEIKKGLSNDYLMKLKGAGKVQIKVGDVDNPAWQPRWLRTKRLFRPWEGGGVVVRMRYPGADGKDHKLRVHEGDPPAPLDGLDGRARVDVQVRVTRRGK